MTILQIIKELQETGYDISYYKRKDGGYRITKIDGQRFTGSSGNNIARHIVGAELSEARKISLMKLKTPTGKGSYNKRRKSPIPQEVRDKIKKLQYQYRKAGKKEGKPTIRNYRYIMKTKGKEEADRLLRQSERRILGLAYVENVEALLMRIRMDLDKLPSPEMLRTTLLIEEKKYAFKDKWIPAIYEILYDWERQIIDGATASARINIIIS